MPSVSFLLQLTFFLFHFIVFILQFIALNYIVQLIGVFQGEKATVIM